jgi:hypothetical protein
MELRGDHNLMSNNLIYNIPNGSEGGIWLVDGNYNTISYNHIYNIAGARGIYLTELIGSGDCYNQITGNMIGNTSNYGIDVDAAGCIGNVLRDNYFFGSLPAGAIHDLGTATIIENNVGYVTDRQKLLRTGSTRPRWYTSPIACTALTTSGAVTNGRMYAMPFMTDKACTLDYFAINVTTLYAGGHMRVGIYLNANGEPGALLTEAATPFDTSGTGVKTTATTQTLLPNTLYWLALLPDNSTNVIQAAALAGIVSILGNDATLPTSPITYFYAAPGYAAMPGTFPTVSQGTGVLPLVYVRLSA